jgi:preprotein translocase subunit SecG
MHTLFRHFTLNRLGAALFLAGVLLLIGGAVAGLASVASGNAGFLGLSGGQAVLLGLACLVFAALLFALEIVHRRLARVEAKLDDLLTRGAAPEEPDLDTIMDKAATVDRTGG